MKYLRANLKGQSRRNSRKNAAVLLSLAFERELLQDSKSRGGCLRLACGLKRREPAMDAINPKLFPLLFPAGGDSVDWELVVAERFVLVTRLLEIRVVCVYSNLSLLSQVYIFQFGKSSP